jgi:hypothetical protein
LQRFLFSAQLEVLCHRLGIRPGREEIKPVLDFIMANEKEGDLLYVYYGLGLPSIFTPNSQKGIDSAILRSYMAEGELSMPLSTRRTLDACAVIREYGSS